MASTFPKRLNDCTLDTFPNIEENKDIISWLKDFADNPQGRSALLLGTVGVGKTGLAVAACRDYENKEVKDKYDFIIWRKATFWPVTDLLDEIRNGYGKDWDILGDVKKVEFLCLDDLGVERHNDWVDEKVFQIINYRYDMLLPTIITSNLTLEDMKEQFGERVVSRFVGMAKIFQVKGRDLRRKQ